LTREIVVTGARGFIGGHLTEHLRHRGDTVRTVVVRSPRDEPVLREALRGAETIVHVAGVVSAVDHRQFWAGNVDVTRAVAAAAAAANARMIHISSLAAGGPAPATSPRRESDPPAPITPYGRSKLEGERVVSATPGLRWTILRPGVVYGPRDRGLLPLFRYASRGLLPLVGGGSTAYMFIHVSDLVRAIAAAIDADVQSETLFVAHPAPVEPRALVSLIRDATNPRARIVPIPGPLLYAASFAGQALGPLVGRPMTINRSRYAELVSGGFVCSVDALRDRLGIVAAVALPEGIRDAARWYREAGWI
jgi:nucleoside-diphosphate-sugar epimerase